MEFAQEEKGFKAGVKKILDNRATWALLAGFAGAFGEKAVGITNALGALFMAIF